MKKSFIILLLGNWHREMRFDIPYHSLYAPDYIVLLIVTKNLVLNNYIYIYIYVEYHLELVMFLAIGLC